MQVNKKVLTCKQQKNCQVLLMYNKKQVQFVHLFMGIYKSVCDGGMEEVPIRNSSVGLAQELLLEGQ